MLCSSPYSQCTHRVGIGASYYIVSERILIIRADTEMGGRGDAESFFEQQLTGLDIRYRISYSPGLGSATPNVFIY
jgi:hypothetical protein